MFTPDQYQKALVVFNDPSFLKQELFLHDYTEFVYKNKEGYTDNGIHWGYVDALVKSICDLTDNTSYGFQYAIILDGPYKSKNISEHHYTNSRFSKAKFSEIKDSVLIIMDRKIKESIEFEKQYNMKKKKTEEITIPLTFEDKEFYLVKYNDNWADEMDIEGFAVYSKEELSAWKKSIPKKNFTYCIGTNEEIEYNTSKELLDRCEIKKISIDEAKLLYSFFGTDKTACLDWNGKDFNRIEHSKECSFGFFPTFSNDE